MEPIRDNKNLPIPERKPEDVSYQVMPHLSEKQSAPQQVVKPEPEVTASLGAPARPSFFKSKGFFVSLITFLVIIVGTLGYLWYANRDQSRQPDTVVSRLPKVWLMQYFNTEACQDPVVCGDEADPESDGLSNLDEFKAGTSPVSPDTDEDGLADGDEVNVYKTDPVLKYTDRRTIAVQADYNDGHSLKNNYDPLTPGILLTETRISQITADATTFGLHEPTITTLGVSNGNQSSSNQTKTISVFIENKEFLPETSFINRGDTVVWLNKDSDQHKVKYNLTSELPNFDSQVLGLDQTFSFTFDVAGTYNYFDELSPEITGVIEVR
ncbi:MAG: hypothetical protein HYW51_02400 [Candidatus Doudnabacteria bacterium]|nr:hypothetical protein [Candidatus Doudnabacteria bacterium]